MSNGPGGTTGTPVTGGVGSGLSFAEPLEATWLSLDRYARILGVPAPPHFFGSYTPTVFPVTGTCDVVVPRHGWQYPPVASREEILSQIKTAEGEIAEHMGFNLAPSFVVNEVHPYPKPYDPTVITSNRMNSAWMNKSIVTKTKKLFDVGTRSASLIGTATTVGGSLSYTDEDGDGFAETATVTYPVTNTDDACEYKVYIAGTGAAPEWEIRYPRSKAFSGGNIEIVFNVWLFLDPDIDARYPDGDYRAIDISDTSNLVTSVDIYRETVDNTQTSARFFWESTANSSIGSGADVNVGALISQTGVAIIRDVHSGILVPRAATYSTELGLWQSDTWTEGRDPDQVRVNYYAGDVSQAYLNGASCDPLKDVYAKAIAYMATARLTRSICSCEGTVVFFESLQEDLAVAVTGRNPRLSFKDLDNPFGTRRGEVMAWRLVGKVFDNERAMDVAII